MDKVLGNALLSIAGVSFIYFCYWAWKDIKREKRPSVTQAMIDDLYISMVENDGYVYEDNQGIEWTRKNGEWVPLEDDE